ncbi:MAG: hypothetical protein HYT38_00380 [Candidatus Sungbacteria bacterium]|uniref:Peptidase M15B domain-containing protein n=1 Tax=Candidatus Sungiibacteriota bacterium TaxID=2750080 RepID=A0A931YDW3_9BACT|nr:hypothetical protein [Candidatus Sungbacteria bacterium]MBI2466160.1 hypothetical protein [Candidatus Sungbacteria bacterium]
MVFPSIVSARLVPCGGAGEGFCTVCDFFSLTQNIFNFVALTLTPIVAVMLIFWGGYMFLISGVNPAGVTKAKSILKNTVIGLVIVYAGYLAASYTVKFFAGETSVAGSRFTTAGFSIQCTRVELPDKTGVKIGDLTETETIPEIVPGKITPVPDIPGLKLSDPDDVDINQLEGNVRNGLSQAANLAVPLGLDLVVTSGFRSRAEQLALATQNCQDPAADRCVIKPGRPITCIPQGDGSNCRHTTGKAVDVWCWQNNSKCSQSALFTNVMKPSGFCVLLYSRPPEPWHFELKTDLDLDPDRKQSFRCD